MKHFLSPREMAMVLGVSESSVKRWADDGAIPTSRTAGGHRRIAVVDALHFVRQRGLSIVNGDLLGMPALRGDFDSQHAAVHSCLMQGDRPGLERILMEHYISGGAIASVCDGPIREAFYAIGELWQHQGDGILIEHRAVDVCLQALSTLRNLLPPTAPDAPCAVGGAPPDDPYLLPSLMAGLVLAEAGWRTVNLGPNTPWETFQTACEQLHPQLVWITVSAPPEEAIARTAITHLQAIHDLGISVALGGRNAQHIHCSHSLRPSTMAELQQIALEQQPASTLRAS